MSAHNVLLEISQAINAGGSLELSAALAPAITQTYSTADSTVATPTAAALTVVDGAGTNNGSIAAITDNASTIAAVQELADQINKLVADELNTRKVLNKVIDALQAHGLLS
jgi:hypothetical protein